MCGRLWQTFGQATHRGMDADPQYKPFDHSLLASSYNVAPQGFQHIYSPLSLSKSQRLTHIFTQDVFSGGTFQKVCVNHLY